MKNVKLWKYGHYIPSSYHIIHNLKRYLILVLLVHAGRICAQQESPDSVWFRNHYYKVEKAIPMRDGIKLFTSIYVPIDSLEKHPILIERTPYNCAPYGTAYFRDFWSGYTKRYLQEKYILVVQDVRGRWMSEGEFVDVRPFINNKKPGQIDESTDAFDTIDWLVKNISGNNGRAGVFGSSYPGFYAGMAAASGHPALKAVNPQAPLTDWFLGDDFHHNGAFFYLDGFNFFVAGGFGRPHPVPVEEESPMPDFFDSKDNYQFFLHQGADKNLLKFTGDSIRFFQELYTHPNYDDWWRARNAREAQFGIKPAMLVVGGLFDAEDCYGTWNLYKAIRIQSQETNVKLVMGPWYHGQWADADGTHVGNIEFGSNTSLVYQSEIEVPFFNYYLKGEKEPSISRITIFFSGENKWRHFDGWPAKEVKEEKIFLQDKFGLSTEVPKTIRSFDEYVSDPAHPVPYTEDVHFNRTRNYMTDDQRFASRRPDVLTYQSGILSGDLTVGGSVIADLRASINTTDADFVVKIIDVFPDSLSYQRMDIYAEKVAETVYPMGGYQMLVRGDIFRGKFRKSFEKPEAFRPGQTETIRFKMPDIAHTFKKGHRLMIQIQSSWFPLSDRNPQKFTDIYTCSDSDFQKSTIRIFHDRNQPSSIILPVLAGKLD